MNLRNIHTVGIVPGQVEFKINHDANSGILNLVNYSVTNRYGQSITSKLIQTESYSIIALDIFQPLLPGFEYIINLDYTLEFDPSGIIFKTFELPLKENTRIPIWEGRYELELPESYQLTYLNYEDNDTVIENGKVTYILSES